MPTVKIWRGRLASLLLVGALAGSLTACAGDHAPSAAQMAIRTMPTPAGRIVTANEGADTLTLIDVATDRPYDSVGTGKQPHQVLALPGGTEFWVTLRSEKHLEVFDAHTLAKTGAVEVGSSSDDLALSPDTRWLYVSLSTTNAIGVVDVATHRLTKIIPVGHIPHGVKVTPDGQTLLVTNMGDNSVSLLRLKPEPAVVATIKTGAQPFALVVSSDGATAYVSNYLGDSVTVLDLRARQVVGTIHSGHQPAMLALTANGPLRRLWVANTGSGTAAVIDAGTRTLLRQVPVGPGAQGVAGTPAGKVYVTNSTANTVTVIDEAQGRAIATIPVGTSPSGLAYLPNIPLR